MIELPEFTNTRVIERTYRRMIELQDRGREPWWNGGRAARSWRDKGIRMALARDPRLLLFLERGAEYLRARNDEQLSRVEHAGYARVSEFSEFAVWRTAYEKAVDPNRSEDVIAATFGWVYAAAAEALTMG